MESQTLPRRIKTSDKKFDSLTRKKRALFQLFQSKKDRRSSCDPEERLRKKTSSVTSLGSPKSEREKFKKYSNTWNWRRNTTNEDFDSNYDVTKSGFVSGSISHRGKRSGRTALNSSLFEPPSSPAPEFAFTEGADDEFIEIKCGSRQRNSVASDDSPGDYDSSFSSLSLVSSDERAGVSRNSSNASRASGSYMSGSPAKPPRTPTSKKSSPRFFRKISAISSPNHRRRAMQLAEKEALLEARRRASSSSSDEGLPACDDVCYDVTGPNCSETKEVFDTWDGRNAATLPRKNKRMKIKDSLDGAITDSNNLKKSNRPSIIQQQRPQSMMINRPVQYEIGNPAYHRDAPVSGTARNARPVSNYSNTSLKSLGEPFQQKSNRSSYYEDGDEKEFHNNIYNNLKESGSIESLDEASTYDTTDIETDPDLVLRNDEQNWSLSVDKKVLKKMQKKDVKRQENIFEFIQTERNYLTVLKVMQKIFSRGMKNELRVGQHFVDKLFPLIDEHVDYVAQFVAALNERQAEGKVVQRIGDLMLKQWSGESGSQMKRLFGDFCSKQNEITSFYKDLLKNDKKFQAFIRKCDKNPLARRMSVPECALFVTQRITKYPIMLQTLCENTVKKDHKEDGEDLDRSLELSREIAKDVDEQVQAHEREQLLIEVYEKTESRTSTTYNKDKRKFDRKDMLTKKRKLLYSLDTIQWKIKDSKKFTDVYFLLLSDCIVLLQENNGKYNFPSGQPAAIPLSKLIVREVASDEKSLYLMSISTEQMYTLKVPSSDERKTLPQKIQIAANNCPDEDENVSEDEEERRVQDEKFEKMRAMIDQLESKDALINKLLSEKMLLFVSMTEGVDKGTTVADHHYTYPNYHSMESENGNNSKIPPCTPSLLKAIEQVKKLSESLYGESPPPLNTPSSAERLTPQLPKRSDTFGGFDNGKEDPAPTRNTWYSSQSDSKLPQLETSSMTSSTSLFNRDSGLVDSDVMVQRTDSQNSIPQAWTRSSENKLTTGSSDTFVTPHAEQVAALAEIAHLLNLHLSVAAQQDTRTEKLQQLLRESQDKPQHRRKTGGSLQEVELKRSQIKQQEQLNDLRRQQQALRSERGQWERQYERFQKSMEEERRQVEEEKKRLLQQKEENERQRDENRRNKEDYQREMSRLRELQRKHQEQPSLTLNRNNSSNQIGDNNLSKSHLNLPSGHETGKAPPSPTYAAGEYPRTFPGLKRDPASQPPVNQVPLHLQFSATNQLARTQGPKHQEIPSKLSNLSSNSKQHGKNSKLSKLASGPQSSTPSIRNKTSIKGMFRNNSITNFLQVPPTDPSTNHIVPHHLIDSSNSSRENERKSPSLKEKLKNETVELFL